MTRIISFAALLLAVAAPTQAQLRVDITSGVVDPIPIAIVPIAPSVESGAIAFDHAAVVEADLDRSGRFRVLARDQLPARPTTGAQVVPADWRGRGADYAVVGRTTGGAGGSPAVLEVELLNLLTGQVLLRERVPANPAAPRAAAHRIADLVYEKILGVRGAFSTRIAYVSVDGVAPNARYQLIVADATRE